jgi:hypothetical protein
MNLITRVGSPIVAGAKLGKIRFLITIGLRRVKSLGLFSLAGEDRQARTPGPGQLDG